MFGLIENLVKATVGVVVQTPLAVVADIVTLGGSITEENKPYTATALGNVYDNLQKAVKPD